AALQVGIVLLAAAAVWRTWRDRAAAFEAKAAVLAVASLLVSPYLFHYDLLWAALAVGWLAMLGLQTGFHCGEREIFLLALLAPGVMPPVFAMTSVQLGFPTLLLLLFVAVRRARTM